VAESRPNGIASAEDFRQAFETRQEAVRIRLPKSGLAVLLRPPNALRVLLISERLEVAGGPESASPDDRRQYVDLMARLVRDIMVAPKLSLVPQAGEVDPNWLPKEDAEFLLKWALGAVTDEGEDISEFFRAGSEPAGRGGAAEAGEAGGDVALPAVGTRRGTGSGGAED